MVVGYMNMQDQNGQRELTGISDWFKKANDKSNGKLRKVVRLSKMFCQSRED